MFGFADKHRGSYSNVLKNEVCPFYCSYSGYQVPHSPPCILLLVLLASHNTLFFFSFIVAFCFGLQDELLWAAAWLHKATKNPSYLNYITVNGQTLGADESDNTFSWDNKHVGARVLLSKVFWLVGPTLLPLIFILSLFYFIISHLPIYMSKRKLRKDKWKLYKCEF